MNRFLFTCLALCSLARIGAAQDDDPFKNLPPGAGSPALLTSALEDATTLVAAEPALVNEAHEKLYRAYGAALTAADAAFAAREKTLRASIAAELEKARAGLDAAGVKSVTATLAALAKGDASKLAPEKSDPATLASVKRRQLARYQRLRAAQGLSHVERIRDYVAALDKLQRTLAAASQLGDAVFVAGEIRGLRELLASGGTGGVPLAAFNFRGLPAVGARTELPAFHCGLPILTALGGDFSESEAFLVLRPPAAEAGTGGRWELRGGYVPENATGGVTLVEAPLIDFPGAEITTREWRGGATKPPVKLLPAGEGFCMIGGLRGPFGKGAEARVAINPTDKTWYLSGKGGTAETTVSAIVVRFPEPSERPALLPKAFTWSGQAPHVRMLDSATSFCAFTRLVGPLDDRATALALAIGPDGYWHLQGRATTAQTAAEATAFTFTPAS